MNSFSSSKQQNQSNRFTLSSQTQQSSNSSCKLFESMSLGYLEDMRRQLFQESAANLMSLYKESIKRCEESYLQGKEDAYEEVLKWFMGFNNGDFKHVSTYEFFNFISSKLQDQRTSKRKQPNGSGLTPTTNASSNVITIGGSTSGQNQSLLSSNIIQTTNRQNSTNPINLSNRLINQNGGQGSNQVPNASIINGASQTNIMSMGCENINIPSNQQMLTNSKDNYIDMLAMVTELEAQNERLSIVPKINFKLNEIKVQDSKKRRRPNSNYQDFQYILSKNQCAGLNLGQNIIEHKMEGDDALAKQFYNQVRFKPTQDKNDNGNELNFFYLNHNDGESGQDKNDQLPVFHQYQQLNEQQHQTYRANNINNNFNYTTNNQ